MAYQALIALGWKNFDAKLILENQGVLTHKSRPNEPLTAFDGMVGAVIDEGRHFITSPRTNYIYMPPLGTRTVTLRKDFRYGEDDFIQWPQPYSVASCHFMCIPRRPQNESDDPLDRLWWTPGFDGFESNGSTLSTAIGKVVWYSLQELKKATDTVLDRARKFLRSNICKPTHRTHVSLMVTTIHNTLCRLEFIPTTRREAFIGVATVQRNALELLGYIDYMQVYLPRITGEHPPATSVGHLVGTFTADPAVVQECVAAGVPVWHIRQWMELEHTRVDALVKPISPESLIIIDQAEPPFCPAYVGSAFAFDKIVAIRNQMDSFTRYPNPFAVSASQVRNVTESLGSVGAPPAQGGGKSVEGTTHLQRGGSSRVGKAGKAARPMPYNKHKRPAQSGGRDKFAPFQHHLLPDCIPAWHSALAKVNRDPSLVSCGSPADSAYVFPDPVLFVSCTPDKQTRYFSNWANLSSAMKYRLRSPETTARPVSTQMWRDLLNGEYFKRLDGVNTNKRREEWLSIMDGLELPPDLGAVNHTMPSVDDAKKILWELFELNFRFELMALDSRMGGEIVPTRSTLELPRQEAIMDCFPASATGGHSLLVANHKAGDQGLAAEHWKDRAPFLVRLRDVMRPWVGSKPAELLELKPMTSYSETGILALESALASYYTQTFFQQFGRAAQIPYRLLTRA